MIARLIERLARHQRNRHGTPELEEQTAASLERMERIVRAQQRESVRVNPVYDRIVVRPRREEHPT